MALILLINPSIAFAAPQILFTTNGAAKQYAPGAVLLVRGWVGENKAGLSGTPTLVVVQNGSKNDLYFSGKYRFQRLLHDQFQPGSRRIKPGILLRLAFMPPIKLKKIVSLSAPNRDLFNFLVAPCSWPVAKKG